MEQSVQGYGINWFQSGPHRLENFEKSQVIAGSHLRRTHPDRCLRRSSQSRSTIPGPHQQSFGTISPTFTSAIIVLKLTLMKINDV